jgi:hypothetical protein
MVRPDVGFLMFLVLRRRPYLISKIILTSFRDVVLLTILWYNGAAKGYNILEVQLLTVLLLFAAGA